MYLKHNAEVSKTHLLGLLSLFSGQKKINFNDASYCRIITVIMTIV
jgi:hypothetical protein